MSEVAATAEPAAPLAGGPSAPPPRGPVGDDPDPTTPFDRPPGPSRRSLFGFFRRSGPGAVGLRRRILLIFTLGSMTLSAFLAVTTYGLVRSNLIEQRYSASRQAAYTNAQVVQRELRSGPANSEAASEQLQLAAGAAFR